MSAQITVNAVITAISQKLDEEFPNIPVSTELIEEALSMEHFYIRVLEPTHTRELHKRFSKTFPLVIHYFTRTNSNLAMYNMADDLMSVLQEPKLDDREIYATDMRFQVSDGVLLFFVTYNLTAYELEQIEKIQTAELEVKVKYVQ